jgi:hypothetical protein
VYDVNDMNESMDFVEQALGSSMRRREFLTKAAVTGAIAWSTPVILSRPAYAAEVGGSPSCRPAITVGPCVIRNCPSSGNSTRNFPGITIRTTTCGCGGQTPTVCATVRNLTSSESDVVAYGPLTDCHPFNQGGVDDIFFPTTPANQWRCLANASTPGAATIFFGKARGGNGMVGQLRNGATITFDLAVWAGNCPNEVGGGFAHTCVTYLGLQVTFNSNPDTATCGQAGGLTFPTEDPNDSLCTTGGVAPCTCP